MLHWHPLPRLSLVRPGRSTAPLRLTRLLVVRAGARRVVATAARNLTRDAVEVLLAHARDGPPALSRRLHNLDLLQLLQDVPDHARRRLLEDEGAGAAVLGAAELPLERAHAEARLKVDLARDGGRARVVPVGVVGGQLLVGARLDQVRPLGQLHTKR